MERIEILMSQAISGFKINQELSEAQAQIGLRIGMSTCLRMPYRIRQLFCRKCKRFIIPGNNARIRIGRSKVKAMRITCLRCMHVYRKIL